MWVNRRNDKGRASSLHKTQKDAEQAAREIMYAHWWMPLAKDKGYADYRGTLGSPQGRSEDSCSFARWLLQERFVSQFS